MKKTKILNNEPGPLEESEGKNVAIEESSLEIINGEEGIEDESRLRKTPQPIEESTKIQIHLLIIIFHLF